ncbi:MAG: hypothetical protein K8L97_05335 [Anaerolineae bacterium]|nr:hypothetical protein [Anaerolineae bacterium]
MLQNIQRLGRGQRIVIFILLMVGGLALLVGLVAFLVAGALSGRSQSVGLLEGVTVQEFAILPDNDSYPAAVAVSPDGRVYTGSYKTGALWVMDTDGKATEIPGSRDAIGAVAGLTVGADGVVYIVDQNDSDPRTSGGSIKRLNTDGTISDFATLPDGQGFVAVDDLARDSAGNLYVSDRGRDEIWRFAPDGSGELWWTPVPIESITAYEPTGLAYDPVNDALIVTDGTNNILYRVAVSDATTTILYQHGDRPDAPGFDGVTVLPDGTIYVAALGQGGLARLEGDSLMYVAGLFRGGSDVDHDPAGKRLYVSNFDSFSLVVQAVAPSLPFTIDVVTLGE